MSETARITELGLPLVEVDLGGSVPMKVVPHAELSKLISKMQWGEKLEERLSGQTCVEAGMYYYDVERALESCMRGDPLAASRFKPG